MALAHDMGPRVQERIYGMIKFAFKCPDGHQFDSWFQSADAYDKLQAQGLVTCAICGRADVTKAIMAPRIATSDKSPSKTPAETAETTPENAPVQMEQMQQMIAKMRDHVEKNSTYVGGSFASEARAQHLGDAPERSIWGEANPTEAKALIEDGVPVAPLPFTPRNKAN